MGFPSFFNNIHFLFSPGGKTREWIENSSAIHNGDMAIPRFLVIVKTPSSSLPNHYLDGCHLWPCTSIRVHSSSQVWRVALAGNGGPLSRECDLRCNRRRSSSLGRCTSLALPHVCDRHVCEMDKDGRSHLSLRAQLSSAEGHS